MRKINAKMAVLAFAGLVGKQAVSLLNAYCLSALGTAAIAAYSITNSIFGIVSFCISVVTLIAIFLQNRILTYVCCGIEALMSILCLAAPGVFIPGTSPSEIIGYGVSYIRISGAIMLVMTALLVLLWFSMKGIRMNTGLILLGASVVISGLLPFLLTFRLGMGTAGIAFGNLAQPFAAVLPLLMMNSPENMEDFRDNGGTRTQANAQGTSHPYLDEYKRKMKGEQ